jgi:hypothetical protein
MGNFGLVFPNALLQAANRLVNIAITHRVSLFWLKLFSWLDYITIRQAITTSETMHPKI